MDSEKKKDALTELVDIAVSQTGSTSNNGTVTTPSGEKVELDFSAKIRDLASKLLKSVRDRKKEEEEVLKKNNGK